MPVMLAFAIVAMAMVAIMYKTFVGYGDYHWGVKIVVLLFLLLGVCSPFLAFYIRQHNPEGSLIYVSKGLYLLFGFVFFLFILMFVRDILWSVIDVIRRAPLENMKNAEVLQKANIVTVILCLLICGYSVYEAEKDAPIKEIEITSPKVLKETKVVMLSDLHIDVDVSTQYVAHLVERVNALNPDAVVIVGDVIDNSPKNLYKQMEELKKLKAKDGVFVTLGNHEFYAGPMDWGLKFASMGFEFLNNYGKELDDTGIYIAGIPDVNAAQQYGMKIKLENAIYQATQEDYTILLAHTPILAEGVVGDKIDLQLSGHTHGGQIFPFHYFSKQFNDGMLAGFYSRKGVEVYVSRGTRYWGPAMRLFAPSEITVFNFKPEAK